MEDVLEVSSEHMALLKEEAAMVGDETLMRYVRIFSELSNQIRQSSQKRVLIEIALIKLCRPQMEQDYEAIVDRLDVVEHKMEEGIPVMAQQASVRNRQSGAIRQEHLPCRKKESAGCYAGGSCRNCAVSGNRSFPAPADFCGRRFLSAYPTVNERNQLDARL